MDTRPTAAERTNGNAGFIRQGFPGRGFCRMNPAFRWWSPDARLGRGVCIRGSTSPGLLGTV